MASRISCASSSTGVSASSSSRRFVISSRSSFCIKICPFLLLVSISWVFFVIPSFCRTFLGITILPLLSDSMIDAIFPRLYSMAVRVINVVLPSTLVLFGQFHLTLVSLFTFGLNIQCGSLLIVAKATMFCEDSLWILMTCPI